MTDFVENIGTKTFGDNDFGKMLDELNPLNLGLSELQKLGLEGAKEEEKKKKR